MQNRIKQIGKRRTNANNSLEGNEGTMLKRYPTYFIITATGKLVNRWGRMRKQREPVGNYIHLLSMPGPE